MEMTTHHRCIGRTATLARCGRVGPWRFFCYDHRFQWLFLLSFLVFTVGGSVASIFSVVAPTFTHSQQSDWRILDIAFYGIRVGDTVDSVNKVALTMTGQSGTGTYKTKSWALPNNNTLVATYNGAENRVVRVEVEWNGNPASRESGLSNFSFGKTTLQDIRERYSSNGFAYARNIMFKRKEGIVTYNAFELSNTPSIIVVFRTRLSYHDKESIDRLEPEQQQLGKIGQFFKLTGIIISEEGYLDHEWGNEKLFDPKSKPIMLRDK
jgi:hypothetical protein